MGKFDFLYIIYVCYNENCPAIVKINASKQNKECQIRKNHIILREPNASAFQLRTVLFIKRLPEFETLFRSKSASCGNCEWINIKYTIYCIQYLSKVQHEASQRPVRGWQISLLFAFFSLWVSRQMSKLYRYFCKSYLDHWTEKVLKSIYKWLPS